jgi:hypothetical protein
MHLSSEQAMHQSVPTADARGNESRLNVKLQNGAQFSPRAVPGRRASLIIAWVAAAQSSWTPR